MIEKRYTWPCSRSDCGTELRFDFSLNIESVENLNEVDIDKQAKEYAHAANKHGGFINDKWLCGKHYKKALDYKKEIGPEPDPLNLEPTEPCDCSTCQSMCLRPGWPTPQEAEKMIDNGLSDQLMLDWYNDIKVLCPANPGYGGKDAPEMHTIGGLAGPSVTDLDSGCVFQDEDGLCQVHNSGYKPFECRVSDEHGDELSKKTHRAVAKRWWDTEEGKAVIEKWKENVK